MSEWASKLMNAVLPDRTKGDFDQYLTEVIDKIIDSLSSSQPPFLIFHHSLGKQ